MHDEQIRRRGELSRIVRTHAGKLALFVGIVTIGTYLICAFAIEPVYRSDVTLLVRGGPGGGTGGSRAFIDAQKQIVLSDRVLARATVVAEDPQFRQQWTQLMGRDARAAGTATTGAAEAVEGFLKSGPVQDRVRSLLDSGRAELDRFRRSIDVETSAGGGEYDSSMHIAVKRPGRNDAAESYQNAAHVADMLADMYVVRSRQLQAAANDPAEQELNDQVARAEREMQQARDAYRGFVKENAADLATLERLASNKSEPDGQVVLARVQESDAELYLKLSRARAMRDVVMPELPEAALKRNGIAGMTDENVAAAVEHLPSELLEDNEFILKMRQRLAELESQQARLRSQFTDESRNVRYVNDEIRTVRRQLLSAIVSHVQGLGATIKALEAQQSQNRALVETASREHSEVARKLGTYVQLKNDVGVAEKQYQSINAQRGAVAGNVRPEQTLSVTKLDSASLPDPNRPVSPRTGIDTLIAFFISLTAGLLLLTVLDRLDPTLHSESQAERYLGMPVLGAVGRHPSGLVAGS